MESLAGAIWGSMVFSESRSPRYGKLTIKANSSLRINPGVIIMAECEILTLAGDVTIDGHGSIGENGKTRPAPEPWTSGPPEDKRRMTANYLAALKDMKDGNPYWKGLDAIPGTDGEDGGTLIVRYRRLGDDSVGAVKGRPNMSGGKGGEYASGGEGRLCINGANTWQNARGPSGESWGPGRDGTDGVFLMERIV